MAKKLFIVSSVVLGLAIVAPTPEARADASAELEQAETLAKNGQYEQAEGIYQQILTDYGGTDFAFQAQRGLTILYIATDNQPQADAAFEQLIANYSNHPDFSDAVCVIGDNFRWRGIDGKARDMYQIAVAGICPSEAIWPQMGLAITSIRLKHYETADALTEQILSDFVGDDRLSQAACLIADAYRSTRHHKQGMDLYQYVIDNHPDSEYAMWSQMGIAICNIDLRNNDAAESAIAKLVSDYAEHPSFYQAVRDIADNYRWRDVHDKAHEMYELAAEGVGRSEAFWPKMGLAITSVQLGDYETAESLTEQLLTQFANHDQLPEAICLIGGSYRGVSEYDKALNLYQTILEVWPASEQALWTKAGMAGIDIARGDQAAAAKAIDNLIADFNDHPVLPQAILAIGQEYYAQALRKEKAGLVAEARGCFTKAIAVWERIIAELPPSDPSTPRAYRLSALCYRRLGQHEKAIEYYQNIVDDWPDHDYAARAQCMVARTYRYLKRTGVTAESEADPKIKAAYERLLRDYPEAAASARNWLNYYNQVHQGGHK